VQKKHFIGILSSLIGTSIVLFALLMMNNPVQYSKKKNQNVVKFDAVEQKKVKQPKQILQIKKIEKPKVNPKPLSQVLAGRSFGIKAFESLGNISDSLLGDLSNVSMNEETVDVAPIPVEQSPLVYPQRARELGVEGFVTLSMLVNQFGTVEKVKLVSAQPEGTFEQSALEAARSWKFRPGSFKGKIVKAWVNQKIVFSLN